MKPSILVVDDEQDTLNELGEFLSEEGYNVETAVNGKDALDKFQKTQAGLVLTDVRMPGMDGIELLRHVKRINEKTSIVIVTGHGNEELAVAALRAGASNYLKKPLDLGELLRTLSSLMAIAQARDLDVITRRMLRAESRILTLPNDPAIVPGAVRYLCGSLLLLFDITTTERIEISLSEMIINAIEHGNLGISYGEKAKAQEEGRLGKLIRSKNENPKLREKKVRVVYRLSPTGVSYRIKDQGRGFDWRSLAEDAKPGDLLRESGRGILLCKLFMDEVVYNKSGNEVRISKYAPSADKRQNLLKSAKTS
jgi:FixJ family two-component response regulator